MKKKGRKRVTETEDMTATSSVMDSAVATDIPMEMILPFGTTQALVNVDSHGKACYFHYGQDNTLHLYVVTCAIE
eukprot:scaffold104578_cov67-Attheya_sp.AAC.11